MTQTGQGPQETQRHQLGGLAPGYWPPSAKVAQGNYPLKVIKLGEDSFLSPAPHLPSRFFPPPPPQLYSPPSLTFPLSFAPHVSSKPPPHQSSQPCPAHLSSQPCPSPIPSAPPLSSHLSSHLQHQDRHPRCHGDSLHFLPQCVGLHLGSRTTATNERLQLYFHDTKLPNIVCLHWTILILILILRVNAESQTIISAVHIKKKRK